MYRYLACLLALLPFAAPAVAGGASSAAPDILLIMPDQFRGDCLSAVGHPVVRTPQLDALAAQGFHALTDGRHKYIWRPKSGREQVFDLAADPHEEHDLALQPGHRELLERWRGRLVRRLARRPEGFSDGQKLITGRAYPALQKPPQPKP